MAVSEFVFLSLCERARKSLCTLHLLPVSLTVCLQDALGVVVASVLKQKQEHEMLMESIRVPADYVPGVAPVEGDDDDGPPVAPRVISSRRRQGKRITTAQRNKRVRLAEERRAAAQVRAEKRKLANIDK